MLDLEPPPAFHLPPPPPPPWLEQQQEVGQCGTCPGQEESSCEGDTFHTAIVILVFSTSMIIILLTLASLLHSRLRKLARKSREVTAAEAEYTVEDMHKLARPQPSLNHYTNLPSEARLVYQYQHQYQPQPQHQHQHHAPVYSDTSLTLSVASSASASASWGQDRRTQSPLAASPDIPVTEL